MTNCPIRHRRVESIRLVDEESRVDLWSKRSIHTLATQEAIDDGFKNSSQPVVDENTAIIGRDRKGTDQ